MDDQDWDEESTWIALIDDDDNDGTSVDSLIDKLGPVFATRRQREKDILKQTFIQVIQPTKDLHEAIQSDIFPRRSKGLSLLEDSSVTFEHSVQRELDIVRATYSDAKNSLEALFNEFERLLDLSDDLFQRFKHNMLEHAQRLEQCADRIPVDAERLISLLQKKAKHLGADDHAKAKENLLRGILEKY